MRRLLIFLTVALFFAPQHAMAEGPRPVVLELFTSQGCSSCPAADALLLELSGDTSLLALSLHVDYWDRLGWKDKFGSPENTARQAYYKKLHGGRTYTPQLIVDGGASAVGNSEQQVGKAIGFVRKQMSNVPVSLTYDPKANTLVIDITSAQKSTGEWLPESATVYAMQFRPYGVTDVKSGENRGKRIENVNNVIRITELGTWDRNARHFTLPLDGVGKDGIVVIVQAEKMGRIVGAARYLPD